MCRSIQLTGFHYCFFTTWITLGDKIVHVAVVLDSSMVPLHMPRLCMVYLELLGMTD